jgi:hypothetical protein
LVFDRDRTSSLPDFGIPIVPDRLWADRESSVKNARRGIIRKQ